MSVAPVSLATAVDRTRTGDLWLFRGRTTADRLIQTLTNAPVNHVGVAIVLEDMPPLIWHAEMGRSLTDVWTRSEEHTSELQSRFDLVCRLLLEKKKKYHYPYT